MTSLIPGRPALVKFVLLFPESKELRVQKEISDYVTKQLNRDNINTMMKEGKPSIPSLIQNEIDLRKIKSPAR